MGKRWMVFLSAFLLMVLTGCTTVGLDFTVSKTGGGVLSVTEKLDKAAYIQYLLDTYVDFGMDSGAEDMVNDLIEEDGYTEEMIDGKSYLVRDLSENSIEFDSIAGFYAQMGFDSGYELTETSFCINRNLLTQEMIEKTLDANDYFDTSNMTEEEMKKYLGNSYLEISVTFDSPIEDTNGTVDAGNPNRASWSYTMTSEVDKLYAFCSSTISVSGVTQGTVSKDSVTLHFEGAESAQMQDGQPVENDTVFSVDGTYCIILKNAEEQKTVYFAIDRTAPVLVDKAEEKVAFKGYQKQKQVIYLKDDGGILSAELDGKSVLECDLLDNEDFVYYVTISPAVLADGKHLLLVKDIYGNQETITFKTDRTAPVVKGVKNKIYQKAVKVKFSDAFSGVKKAVLNGKKITSGTKVKEKGKYTLKVWDKAGNKTIVKFKIKEKKVKKKTKAKKK